MQLLFKMGGLPNSMGTPDAIHTRGRRRGDIKGNYFNRQGQNNSSCSVSKLKR